MKILLGLDDSQCSQDALDHVLAGAWPEGSRFTVLSAVAPIFAGSEQTDTADAISRLIESQRIYHREIADRAAAQLREAGFPADAHTVVADPRDAILDAARSRGVDLIVVGSHGRTGIKKLLLGSVASHVVTHAPCSVLVVRGKDKRHE